MKLDPSHRSDSSLFLVHRSSARLATQQIAMDLPGCSCDGSSCSSGSTCTSSRNFPCQPVFCQACVAGVNNLRTSPSESSSLISDDLGSAEPLGDFFGIEAPFCLFSVTLDCQVALQAPEFWCSDSGSPWSFGPGRSHPERRRSCSCGALLRAFFHRPRTG